MKSVKNTEQKYDNEGNLVETPKNLEKYNYYIENKQTKKREYLSFNGNWNSSFQKMWPQELVNDYVLEISENFKDDKAQKSTEYHYGDNKYNDLVSIYDLSGDTKRLYSVSDIQRSNNNHTIIEALRLVNDDGGDYYCTLKKTRF